MTSPIRLKHHWFDGGQYAFASGLGAAALTVPAGPPSGLPNALLTVSAWCSAPGATVTIQIPGFPALPAIPIPPGGSMTVDLDGAVCRPAGGIDVTFVGTDGYFVDWVQDIP